MSTEAIKGKAEELKGKIKQAAAHLTNDPELHAEGELDEAVGHARGVVADAKRKVGDAIGHVADAIKK